MAQWQQQCLTNETQLLAQRNERIALFGERTVAEAREQLRTAQIAAEHALQQATELLHKAQEQRDRLAGQWVGLQQQQQQQAERGQQAEQQWQQALASSTFDDEAAFNAALLDDDVRQRLQQHKEQLQERQVRATTLLAQAVQALEQHRLDRPAELDETQVNVEQLTTALSELAER